MLHGALAKQYQRPTSLGPFVLLLPLPTSLPISVSSSVPRLLLLRLLGTGRAQLCAAMETRTTMTATSALVLTGIGIDGPAISPRLNKLRASLLFSRYFLFLYEVCKLVISI